MYYVHVFRSRASDSSNDMKYIGFSVYIFIL